MSLKDIVENAILEITRVTNGEYRTIAKIPFEEGNYRIIKTKTPRYGVEYALANPWGDVWFVRKGESAAFESLSFSGLTVASEGEEDKLRQAVIDLKNGAYRTGQLDDIERNP